MIAHHFTDGVYAKEIRIPAGKTIIGHKHKYDHISILAKGLAVVEVDLVRKEYKAPACISIEKNKHHAIIAMTNVVWYCIHASDEKDVTKMDKTLIGDYHAGI